MYIMMYGCGYRGNEDHISLVDDVGTDHELNWPFEAVITITFLRT